MKLIGLLLTAVATVLAASEPVLIRNVDVYPVTSAPVKGVSVLIQDGKIADIGPKLVPAKGVRVVEGKGLRVYPGMIDSGTQLGLSEIAAVRETVDAGELGEYMPQLRALVAVNPESEHFPVARVNGITSVMTFPNLGGGGRGAGAQVIAGQAALIHTDGWTWEEMEISRTAALHVRFPALSGGGRGGAGVPDNVIELLGGTPAGGGFTQQKRNYDLQVSRLNDFFEDARRYQKARAANAPGFKPDLKFEAILPILDRKVPLAVSADHVVAIKDAIAFADKQNVRIVLLQPRDIRKVAADLKAKNIPVILGKVLDLPNEEDDSYDSAFSLPAEVFKAGVKFAFGSFDASDNGEFVRNLPYNAAAAVSFGLPYDEALKALTINPAEIWGVADRIGSVEKGKIADLMITDGDPLEIQTQVKYLFINGKEVALTNKQTRLYEKYMSRQ